MLRCELCRYSLDLDEGDKLAVDSDAIVRKFALDLVLRGQVVELVVAEYVSQKPRDEDPRIALIRVTCRDVRERFRELPNPRADPFPRL